MKLEEKRQAARLEKIFPVKFLGEERTVQALDVSWLGVKIVTDNALEERDYTLVLEVDPDVTFTVEARPVWYQALNQRGRQVVGFSLSPDPAALSLRDWLETQAA